MKKGVNNYSEIGRLNKVLLHRIGDEIEGLVQTISSGCCLTIYRILR